MTEHTYQFHDPQTMLAVANRPELQATSKRAMWHNPENNRIEQLDSGHQVVYNGESGRIFGVVTEDYSIVNPPQFFGPLAEEMIDRDRTDGAGEFYIRDGGARGYAEILFDGSRVYPPGRSESNPVKTGFAVSWSHDGGVSVSARGFAQDTQCSNSMRRVTDSVYVKHSGDTGGRVDWNAEWETLLTQLGTFNEMLIQLIDEASEFTLFDLDEHEFSPDWMDALDEPSYFEDDERGPTTPPMLSDREMRGLFGLFDYLGLPNYLSVAATDRLGFRLAQSDDPMGVTAWHAYSAATFALSHHSRATPGTGADDGHFRTVNDLLMNPHGVVEQAEHTATSRLRPDAAGQIALLAEDLGEKAEQYHERAQRLTESLSGGV